MLFRTPETAEFYFEEGCYILELLNDPADPEASVARARLPAGQATRFHHLMTATERYVILEGEGQAHIGDAPPFAVRPGDVVLIPAGTRQRLINTGRSELVFLAVCTPRFRPEDYRDG
jgi:mannose-6-phosphate isomerase-like protein (cupin superfamily)